MNARASENYYDIAVIGPGAIGILYTVLLGLTGAKVLLVARNSRRAEVLRQQGLQLIYNNKIIKYNVDVVGSDEIDNYKINARIVIVAVKAYDTRLVAPVAAKISDKNGLIVTIQNGLGNVEALSEYAPGRVIQAVTTWGAYKLDHNISKVGGVGETIIPSNSHRQKDTIEWFGRILRDAGLNPVIVDDIRPWVWKKLAVNASINPITAIIRAPNGIIIKNKFLKNLVFKVVEEVVSVAAILGIDIGDPKDIGNFVLEVARKTSNNYSSMLQDILKCKRTEIDAINGAIVRIAEENGLSAPTNATLHALVKGMEESERCSNHY